jgi:RNA polymerase sigma-70 factor (ECF subfamily)
MPDEPEESARLMQRLAAGDERALAALYERWAGPLLGFLVKMCGDRALAEDILQEVFLRVWRAAPTYQPTARYSTWLFHVARNAWLNEREKLQRRPRPLALDAADDGDSAPLDPEDPSAPRPDRTALDRELGRRIDGAVARLPDKLREVWILGAAQGLPYPEVAEILGIPVGTVKSRMFQAVRLLRSDLEPYVA